MPMIQDGKLDRHGVSGTSLDALAGFLNFGAEVKRPGGVCAGCIENRSDVVLQHHGRKEANVDVSGQLEDVFVLPTLYHLRVSLSISLTPRVMFVVSDLPLLLRLAETVPGLVLPRFVDREETLRNLVVVP